MPMRRIGMPVNTVLPDNGHEYYGTDNHHFELYLKLNNIEHHKNKVRPNSNSLVQQFIEIATTEFFNGIDDLESIQIKFNQWLYYYNNERPFPGFPNPGKPPEFLIRDTIPLQTKNK